MNTITLFFVGKGKEREGTGNGTEKKKVCFVCMMEWESSYDGIFIPLEMLRNDPFHHLMEWVYDKIVRSILLKFQN